MVKFSILIAHYNNYDYFKECYHSILKQTFSDYEIILVDDYSSYDSYQKIVELTKDNTKVKIFRNKENKGVGYTKRRCAEMASGEICGFVDPDDAITENALQVSIENHTKDSVVTYSKFHLCDSELKPVRIFQHSRAVKNGKRDFFNVFLEANHFFTFKKEAYDKTIGINPELTSAVDQDLYLKLYEMGKFKFINIPLYYYRLHEKGVSQESSKKGKLNQNWQKVILDTAKRRNIQSLYKENINRIENLPEFILKNQNTLFKRILRKLN
ncbi:MAG: glycosyltransferase family 2 protein [Chryseobacterium sp.]|uniref:glycosyltransferase family 2 protein n=1 Tax=Chryseobacterium sp. TaxID=1871047 RepID=UPI001B2B567B|nr:glycosyltransferase family 2 protein [Chryseobacterium sp.]MBO6183967.1 glycosyltransferase family 2 protein [Chryseobacterium sp.]